MTSRKALATCSALAPPPTSRKLAGSPPLSLTASIVAIARPAPLTMQPILPSSFTKEMPERFASSLGFVLLRHIAQRFVRVWRKRALSSKDHLGVERQPVAVAGEDQRVDLGERGVFGDIGFVQRLRDRREAVDLIGGNAELESRAARAWYG